MTGECRFIRDHPTADYKFTLMTPVPFLGLGAFYRLQRAGHEKYSEFGLAGYTARDMSKWHNAAVRLLEG